MTQLANDKVVKVDNVTWVEPEIFYLCTSFFKLLLSFYLSKENWI